MNTTLYIFKRPNDDLFWTSSAIILLAFSFFIIFSIIQAGTVNLLAFLFPIILSALALIIFKVVIIRRQYYKIDKDKRIFVDKTNTQIKIVSQQEALTISHQDIDNIEIYSSWNTVPLFSQLGYIRLNLLNGHTFIVTKFTADEYDLETIIAGHRRTTIKRLMNKF